MAENNQRDLQVAHIAAAVNLNPDYAMRIFR